MNERIQLKVTKKKVKIVISENLCIYEPSQRDYTLNLLGLISAYAVGKWIPVHIDMSNCQRVTAAASVMLFAEISRARIATENDDIVTLDFPEKGQSCRTALNNIGWIHAASISYRKINTLFEHDAIFQSGNNPGKATASVYKQLVDSGVPLTAPEVKKFTKGVTEAMLNVNHHAYDNEKEPLNGIGRRWWQLCLVRTDENDKPTKLLFIIYDLGQGILRSLPKKVGESNLDQIGRAMTYGVTRTKESDRGKGSEDMLDAAEIKDNSVLYIGTNSVTYTKMYDMAPIIEPCSIPFFGTIVEWQINL
ncbi:TPA: hypothetical protein NKP78_003159 [Vibrio parahaemolyticus]|nr:hypothetical protein FQ332_09610 [Vibrio diabolicus]HCH1192656.1 hypothetical protein [Vibrio parahaemolyticus]